MKRKHLRTRPTFERIEDRVVPAQINHAPVGYDYTAAALEDTPYVFQSSDFGFTDPQDSPAHNFQAIKIVNLPTAGTLTNNGIPVIAGDFISAAAVNAGLVAYLANTDANGVSFDGFGFQVQDDGGTAFGGVDLDVLARLMTIDVAPVNDAPTLVNPGSIQAVRGDLVSLSLQASDADGDPLSFSATGLPPGLSIDSSTGVIAGTISSSADTSEPFAVRVTVSDGMVSTERSFSWSVYHTAAELYSAYTAAVEDANGVYLAAVADRDTAIMAARAAAQADADDLYADYEDDVALAQADYDAAIADADDAYEEAVADGLEDWEPAIASYRAAYEAAIDDATDDYDSAMAGHFEDYDDAIIAADQDYEDYLAPHVTARDDAYAAWQLDPENTELEQAFLDAQDDLDDAILIATAERDDDYDAALTALQADMDDAGADRIAAQELALDDYVTDIDPAKEDWEEAEDAAWTIYLDAIDDADAEFVDAESTAWTAYQTSVAAIKDALVTVEASIESQYAIAVADALAAWETAEDATWDQYTAAMSALPGSPALDARITSPPALVPFTLLEGPKLAPTLIPPQPHFELELFVVQQSPRLSDALERRRWYDARSSGTIPGGGETFTLAYDYFTTDERDRLLDRLTTLRGALNTMLADLGGTDASWLGLTGQTRERLRRWFGNGNALSDSEVRTVRSYFQAVRNAFDGTLKFENAFDDSYLGWAFPGWDIHLGLPFWAPDFSAKNQIGTLLHEMVHRFNWVTDKGYFYSASLDPGPPGGPRPGPTYWLGAVDVNLTWRQLQSNPDSYAGFMMDYYLPGV